MLIILAMVSRSRARRFFFKCMRPSESNSGVVTVSQLIQYHSSSTRLYVEASPTVDSWSLETLGQIWLDRHAGRRQFLILDPQQNGLSQFAINIHFRVIGDS